MDESQTPCHALAEALAAAEDPGQLLPAALPCPPLDLLIALHHVVRRAMLVDLSHAQRGAAAAWTVARRFPDEPILQAQAHWTAGAALLHVPAYARALDQFDAARACYERACTALAPEPPPRDIRPVHINRVFCLSELGRYGEALQAVEAAERWLQERPDDAARLILLLNRSQLAGALGDYPQMIALADETVALAESMGDPARAAQGWVNRAYACIYLGRHVEADAALDQASILAERAEEPLTLARAQCNRAWLLHRQGRLFEALAMLREAQRGLAQADGERATTTLEEAVIYAQLRQLPEAIRAARFAAEQFAQQAMPAYSAEAALQGAKYAMEQGQLTTAERLLALARIQADRAGLPTLHAQVALAEAARATVPGSARSARALARERQAARRSAAHAIAILEQHGMAQEVLQGQLAIAALNAQLGAIGDALETYSRLAQHPSRQVQMDASAAIGALLPPSDALPFLQRAASLAVEQRRALPMEELQARYSGETSHHHMNLAGCHLACGDVARAYEAVCEAKAGPLLDLRAASGLLDSATRAVVEQGKADFAHWRAQAQELLRKARRASQLEQHEAAAYHDQQARTAIAAAEASEQALTTQLRTLDDRQGSAPVPTAADIQLALEPDAALLEYVQIADDLGCFLVRPRQPIRYRRLGAYGALAPLLDRWCLVVRRLIDVPAPDDAHDQIRRALAPLWNMMLAPWEAELAGVGSLLIAPYGILHHVPWAAIPAGEQHLGDHVTLRVTPCGALSAAPPIPASAPLGPPRLLSYAGRDSRFLAHVGEEIAGIARHVPDAQIVEQAAAADLRVTPAPRMLHIAAHGLTNPSAPLCSTIELADGPFLLLEAHRLDLRGTELVTLSACETSVRPDHGDMALALAGAFLCAGARAVMASLWPVSDTATAQLMERFYAAAGSGHDYALALKQAQQHVRAMHPIDWAAFQILAGAR